ncbi:MAG: hypothetical protein EXS13_11325 [Planctomycetes bacterium]|nr:hypothetical protein [Planctomycetota bacterium]
MAWPSSIAALAGVGGLAAFALLSWVALLARSDGDLALQAAAAAEGEAAGARWRGAAWAIAIVALGLGVIGLVVADDGAVRGRLLAALLGVGTALSGQWLALRIALAAAPRIVAAAAQPESGADDLARRAAAIATASGEAIALLVAAIAIATLGDARALIALATGAAVVSALLSRAGELSAFASAVAAGEAGPRLLIVIALPIAVATDPAPLPWMGAVLTWIAVARLITLAASRLGLAFPLAGELAAALIVPPFFAAAPSVGALTGWSGAAIQVPLLLGIGLAPVLARCARWLATRGSSRTTHGHSAWWIVWCGAMLAIASYGFGEVGVAWLVIGFAVAAQRFVAPVAATLLAQSQSLATTAGRSTDAVARLAAASPHSDTVRDADLAAFAELMVAAAGILALGGGRGAGEGGGAAAGLQFSATLGGLLAGVVAALVLERLVARPPSPAGTDSASTGRLARAMIPASLFSALIAFGVPRVAPALSGSVFGGMLAVGLLTMPTGSARTLVPRWLVVMVLLALAVATVPNGS